MEEISNELRNIFWDDGKIIIKKVLAPEPRLTEECILLCKIYTNQPLTDALQKLRGCLRDKIIRFEHYGESLNSKILDVLETDLVEYLL